MPAPLPTYLKKLLGQRGLIETIGNASILVLFRFGGAVAGFLFTYLIARHMAPEEVGFVLTALSLAILASLAITLNVEAGAVRHLLHPVEQGRLGEATGFVSFGRKLMLYLTVPVVILFTVFLLASQAVKNELTTAEVFGVLFTAASLPILAFIRLESTFAHALSYIKRSMVAWGLLRPVLLLMLTAAGVAAGVALGVDTVLLASLAASLAAFGVQLVLLHSAFRFTREAAPDTSKHREWLSTGLFLAVTILLIDYFQYLVVVTAALGLSDADVARLGIALRFIGFLRIGLMAVNMAVSPRISRAVSAGNQQEADSLLVQSTHLKFWPTVLVTALVWWLAPFLVGLFGPEYASADWALRLFALLPLVAAFFGPSIMILNITGHQPQIFRVSAACVVLLVVAVPVAGVAFGVNGAALAAVLTVFFWEWALFNRVRRETGYNVSITGVLFGSANREVRGEA